MCRSFNSGSSGHMIVFGEMDELKLGAAGFQKFSRVLKQRV